jgi:ABC-2 type transport system permease protein|tara:strand:+ start:4662 stop:5978 length:1317 start_codon:yes stop_codon:yes gene_type:complete
MNPFIIIALREFTSRVKNKTFILMSIIGPLAIGALLVIPALFSNIDEDPKKLLVVDNSYLLVGTEKISKHSFQYLNPEEFDEESAISAVREKEIYDGLLFLPPSENGDPDFILRNTRLYSKGDIGIDLTREIERRLGKLATEEKLKINGVDPSLVKNSTTIVNIKNLNLTEKGSEASSLPLKMAIGFGASFFIYMFTFFYSAQIMRGVIEEKTSRIVEVMITSVKPTQLLLGKIIGIAGVGLLQFLILIAFSTIIYSVAGSIGLLGSDISEVTPGGGIMENTESQTVLNEVIESFKTFNIPKLIGFFVFYWLGGYLLYGALFAAAGSAVDAEADTQQFMIPLTVPLLITLMLATPMMQEPNGTLAIWLSLIPFSSPLAMMIRLPFGGVQTYEIALSMILLIIGFLGTTWISAKIYRVGILTYGKKASYKDLYKWLRRK